MAKRLKFLTGDMVQQVLDAINAAPDGIIDRRRCHAFVFLGYYLGLRISEACLLERSHVRSNPPLIPTLKQARKIKFQCPECRRTWRVAARRGGKSYTCPNCDHVSRLPVVDIDDVQVPLVQLPFIEGHVREYLDRYLKTMPRDQDRLFLGNSGRPCTRLKLYQEFKQSMYLAGLPSEYAPHALRHGRGQHIWTLTSDLKAVQAFLRHSSANTASIYVHLSNMSEYQKRLDQASFAARPVEVT